FDGVTDCYGRALPPVSFSSLSEVDESGNIVLRVKAAAAIRYDGTSVPIEDTMPADIKEFVFTLNSRISKYEEGITLNGAPLALAYDDLERTLTASVDGLLEGSTTYALEVNDNIKNSADVSIKPYENSFTTEEGRFEIRDFKWCDGEGNEILPDEVSMGETYYLTVDAVNTTSSPKTVVLTYAAISGEQKSGFNYKEISIPKAGYINESISYQAQAADEKVSGFVTDSFSSLKLLDKPAYLINNDITESTSDLRCTVSQDGYGDIENAAVQVYEPGRDASSVSSNPPIYQDVIAPQDGKLEFDFAVLGGRSGVYNIYISNPDGGTAKYLTYNYVNPEANAAALKWLNSLSAVPAAEEFESKSDDLGFHCDLYESNKTEFLKLVYEDSLAKAFEGAKTASAAAALNKLAIQAALNNGNSVDIFKYSSDIDLAGSRLGRILDKDFVTETLMSDVSRRMLEYASAAEEKGSSNVEIFDSNLIQAFVLATVNYSDGYGNIREVVSEFKGETGISSSDITTVALQAVDGKNYNTYAALAEAMKNANTSKNVSGGSGGSGSSGSNGSGGVSNVTIDTSVYGGQEAVVAPSDPYNDIASVPWARDAIINLTNRGIISGNGNGEFLPDNAVKREEFTKMAVIAFANTDTVQINTFEDVSGNEWYAQYINAAAALGIVNGQSKNLFGVGQTITRQDMAVIVYKAAAYSGIELGGIEAYGEFTDDADISEYAAEAVYKLMAAGIINGVGDGRFAPLDSATRAEAAKLVYSLLTYTR
ncbi:MAG: S-layer homology domain-containing protein, partial [Clostridia bacterium]|nr:S-layer homology domain-containing protein [Clostridia bacterium]